jgi:hypothetical protein
MKTETEIRAELYKVRELQERFRAQGFEADFMLWGAQHALSWSTGAGRALSDIYTLLEDFLVGNGKPRTH